MEESATRFSACVAACISVVPLSPVRAFPHLSVPRKANGSDLGDHSSSYIRPAWQWV